MRIGKTIFAVVVVSLLMFAASSGSNLRAVEGDERFWSFQPVHVVSPPTVRGSSWIQSPVDHFVLAKLEAQNLAPSSAADRRTLIRRATFDLWGLPPTPDEVEAFLTDDSPDAFRKVVDRLLASPQYGQRWGRHWLDVVRYADARDLIQLPAESDFREAWRYRDWVVNAFNRDLPYDQFVMQQVAGDLLQPADRAQIDADALVATGMLAIADFVPGDVDKQQMIADYVNDQIDVVGRAFLGLTLACARCHDHKFDPVTTEDYYALAGIFFSSRLVPGPVKGNTPLVRAPLLSSAAIAAIEAEQARDKARLAELKHDVETLGESEYQAWIERQVETESERYLLAAWEWLHPASGQAKSAQPEFAKTRNLDPMVLSRWVTYLDEPVAHPALSDLRSAPDLRAAEVESKKLATLLVTAASDDRSRRESSAAHKSLAGSSLLHFQANDRRMQIDKDHVTLLPNRGRVTGDAVATTGNVGPGVASLMLPQRVVPALKFTGNESLEAPVTVPATGSLFVVFRPDPAGPAGQRLIGWEDAAVGQHGVGLMTDGAGSLHAVLRRQGASGDVVVPANPALASTGFQFVCLTWGPGGVTVHRNGQPVGNNPGIESVSSDPAITALRIGESGSGPSPKFRGELAELRVYRVPLDDQARTIVEAELTASWLAPEMPPPAPAVPDLYAELVSARGPFRLEPAARDQALPPNFRGRLAGLRAELETLEKKPAPEIPRAVVIQEGGPAGTPHEGFHDAHIYTRGNHAKPGRIVPRGFPKVLAGERQPAIREGSGRRELARWLVSSDNPLTARVMVNRIWQHRFGVGLVPTSANFGEMGERPSHPELLDFLASQFVSSGWSVKSMHRLMMLSSTYQQSSTANPAGLSADPENRLLWRANRRKLESEAFRDNLLAVAGRLDLVAGGPGFQEVANPRRTIYLMGVRTGAKTAEFGALFDAADCTGIVERRTQSIVAPQALFLMNDPFVADLAKSLSERIFREGPNGTNRSRIQRLYEIAVGRPATELELEIGLSLVGEEALDEAWTGYCRVVLSSNEMMFVD